MRDWRDMEDGLAIGRRAAERALRRLNARKLSTTTAPVLFVPELARGLFGHFLGAIRGGSQYRRASFLLDAAGQSVFPSWMRLSERPHIRKALGSLETVERIVKLGVFINSASSFIDQPKVANGASELMEQVLGAAGQHARSAVGVPVLPLGAAVEVDAVIAVRPA